MKAELDISSNRAARKYLRRELACRLLWAWGEWLFWISPRPCFAWRRFILRCFGAQLGCHVNIDPSARIHFPWNLSVGDWSAIGERALIYNLGHVTIGTKVTISHGAHLCAGTHDYTRVDLPLLKPSIRIEDQAWICAEAFVGPGVAIGQGAIVGARAVVTKNVPAWSIVAGNPARPIGTRQLCSPVSFQNQS